MLIYGSSRADVNRVSKVICVILTAQCNWFKKPTLPFFLPLDQSSVCPNTSVFQRFEPLASLFFSLWLILRGPLLSSDCSLQLPWIWCYETRAKVL